MIVDVTKWAARRRLGSAGTADPGGILLGATSDGKAVCWPPPSPERASHVSCMAASGAGKTILIAHALLAEFTRSIAEDAQPLAHLVVDPKGDLIAALLSGLAASAPEHLARVRYLNPFSEDAFPFNLNRLALGTTPVDVRAMALAGLCAQVSTARGSQAHLGVGARQVELLENIHAAALGVADPRASVLLGMDALTLPQGLKRLASLTTNPRAKAALESAHVGDELRASCASRMRMSYAATEALERIVSASTSVQFSDLLAPGTLTLVDLGQPTGGLLTLTSVWANLLVRLAVEHLLERPSPWKGQHVRLVIDEAHLVAAALADVAEVLYTTGRSRGVSIVAITQGSVLLREASTSLWQVIQANVATKLIGRLAAADAELLSKEQAAGPGVETTRGAVRDGFISAVTNLPDREFFALSPGSRERFRTLDVDMEEWRSAGDASASTIEQVRRRYALPAGGGRRATLDDLAPQKKRQRSGARTATAPRRGSTRWG